MNIWAGDLFEREREAELLIGYLESISARPPLREDAHGFTLAIDARYGEGKTFFLKRLSQHLGLNHPVAFVDAWTDDLADEPLTALAATLKKALDPLIAQSEAMETRFEDFVEKSGKIAKIAAVGLLKRGAAMLITAGAVEAAEQALTGVGEAANDAAKSSLEDSGIEAIGGAIEAFRSVAPSKLMNDRIDEFEQGQAAIQEMRASLAELVDTLQGENLNRPIFIIIDELDRCRPTYAVKLLEEIKHLFDVPGIVFILGLHGEQLSHSIGAAYGTGFDSKSYLRRFFSRQYRLAEPDLFPLVEHLCTQAGILTPPARYLNIVSDSKGRFQPSAPQMIALYMAAYGMSARSAFEIVDILQTCFAIAGRPLYLNYLLPLIIGHIQGLPEGELPASVRILDWKLAQINDAFGKDITEIPPDILATEFRSVSQLSHRDVAAEINTDRARFSVQAVFENGAMNGQSKDLTSIRNYPKLLNTVRRFKNPNLEA